MNCYNCGIPLTKKLNHREHIPAKNLYKDLEEKYKQKLITVPACFECNNQFSQIDQEIRDAIGILNNKDEYLNHMTSKSVKSIVRRKEWQNRVSAVDGSNLLDIKFNYSSFKKSHIKNFKGLYYYHFNETISKDYQMQVVAEGDENNNIAQQLRKHILSLYSDIDQFNFIGHRDVFKYKIKKIFNSNGIIVESGDENNKIGFIGNMIYCNVIHPVIIATNLKLTKHN